MSIIENIDCIEAMKKYPDKYFDLAICDVPYGINVGNMAFVKENKTKVKQKNGNFLNPNKGKIIHEFSDWDKQTPTQEYFDELVRVSKNQIIFGVDYVDWKGLGSGRIKWDKGVPEGVSFKRYEIAYCSMIYNEITIPLLWAGMCQAKSLSEPMVQQGNKKLNEKRIHPCHKPIMLYQILLQKFAKKGDIILDTHVGGGSSRIASDQMGFDYYGFEIDKKTFDRQEKRYAEYKSQTQLF